MDHWAAEHSGYLREIRDLLEDGQYEYTELQTNNIVELVNNMNTMAEARWRLIPPIITKVVSTGDTIYTAVMERRKP